MMNRDHIDRRYPVEHFINRELGLLAFNRRVLAQAEDKRMPLLERLRFLCILSSNLDEFFEVRLAGIKEQIKLNSSSRTTDGKTAQEAFRLVSQEAHAIITEQYHLLNEEVLPALASEGISMRRLLLWMQPRVSLCQSRCRRFTSRLSSIRR